MDAGEYLIYFADNGFFIDQPKKLELTEGSNMINISPLSTFLVQKIKSY